MKAVYRTEFGPYETAMVECAYYKGPNRYWINALEVPLGRRRQGYGTALMEQVLEDADREGITLCLEVEPYGDMDRQALYDWYSRLGFQRRGGGKTMVRRPAA